MKRYLLLFATLALMGIMVSCQREQNVPEKNPAVYSNFEVSLSGDTSGSDTKSLIDQVTESRFDKAMLFAFDKNGNILTYGPNAGELEGLPIITSTASKSFVWPLPLNTAMDIYTIVNFGTMDLSSYNKASLTRAELEELTFSCASANDLIKLASTEDEGYGIPQSGILEVSANDLKTGTESLSIKVRRVFARFDLYFDLYELEAKHDHVNVESCTVYNMNTEVKYFPHYTSKNAASHIGSPYDEADRDQRTILGMGGSENKVTLYVLENMQGYRYTDTDAEVKDDTKTPASAWYTVYNELGATKLSKCTFLELNVLLYNNGEDTERAEHRNYRLYLSEDVGSACNFNIPRNMRKTMKIRIMDQWPGPNPNVDYFTFVDEYGREERKLPMVNPGETAKLYFKTNLQAADVDFATTDVDSGASSDALSFSEVQNGTINHMPGSRPFSVSGDDNFYYVNVTVDPSTKVGTKLSVKGGDLSNGIWDTKYLKISEPSITITPSSTVEFYDHSKGEKQYQIVEYAIESNFGITRFTQFMTWSTSFGITWRFVDPETEAITNSSGQSLSANDALKFIEKDTNGMYHYILKIRYEVSTSTVLEKIEEIKAFNLLLRYSVEGENGIKFNYKDLKQPIEFEHMSVLSIRMVTNNNSIANSPNYSPGEYKWVYAVCMIDGEYSSSPNNFEIREVHGRNVTLPIGLWYSNVYETTDTYPLGIMSVLNGGTAYYNDDVIKVSFNSGRSYYYYLLELK